ncbi:natural killer cells antigen CD94-like isoform X2 [Siniperca chuatsi]|uniref:natural killer cells antigen CD94-like isoform X2 n=1 Tax=Siniperca chuatsi TaxID=119488 RepID=UPI001CE02E42|nr:natural killer cells antigen CD94-like isoform X2 [Siniperca chuatsi]
MSSNIYEDPNLNMNVRYCKGVREDGGEKVERVVDIYEGAATFTDHRGDLSTHDGGAHAQTHLPAVHRNPFGAAALVLGLLCLLLVGGVTVLYKLYISIILENKQLHIYKASYENLSNSYCQLQEKESQTRRNITEWKRFRCSCYYKSTEMKNWTDSRRDCQNRGADLVIINNKEEQEFVSELNEHGASWIGLQSVKTKHWEWKWEWVDTSRPTYLAWQVDVNVNPVDGLTAYINLQGTWTHTNNGSNRWICEKPIY